MQREYFVYLYKDKRNGDYVYIGKATGQRGVELNARIKTHATDRFFWPYLPYVEILLWEVTNKAEARGLELLLINEYKPVLNKADKYRSKMNYKIPLPDTLKTYEEYLKTTGENLQNKDSKRYQTFLQTKYQKALKDYEQTKVKQKEVLKFVDYIKSATPCDDGKIRYYCTYAGLYGMTIKTEDTIISIFLKCTRKDGIYTYLVDSKLVKGIIKYVPSQIEGEVINSYLEFKKYAEKYKLVCQK